MHKTYTMHFPIKTRKAERKYHMEIKTELETYLKCTDEASTEYFKEGDKVICYAGGHKYDGKIKAIGAKVYMRKKVHLDQILQTIS